MYLRLDSPVLINKLYDSHIFQTLEIIINLMLITKCNKMVTTILSKFSPDVKMIGALFLSSI
jgi:hypothetical protein